MSFDVARQESVSRFREAQALISEAKQIEVLGEPASAALNVQKALAIVLVYGALEFSFVRTLNEAVELINLGRVYHRHVSQGLLPLALDAEITSLSDISSGRRNKWRRRVHLFERQICDDIIILNGGAFSKGTQNIRPETISDMFLAFGLSSPPLYDPSVAQYIGEIVERRNAVAHGRESASTVGQAYNGGRLQKLHDVAFRQIQHVFQCFETYYEDADFVANEHRARYRS